MNKKKRILLCVLLLTINVLLVSVLSILLVNIKLKTKEVFVANMSLPERTKVKEEYLRVINVPECFLSDDVYYQKEDILDKYVKLNAYIPKGSLIYKDFLENKEDMVDFLHLDLKENETTYDLFVKDIEVNTASLLKDMKVDLYLTVNKKEVLSDLLIENCRISALYDKNSKEIKNPNENSDINVISIVLNKDYVTYLNKAIVIGKLKVLVSNNLYNDDIERLNESSQVFDLLSW